MKAGQFDEKRWETSWRGQEKGVARELTRGKKKKEPHNSKTLQHEVDLIADGRSLAHNNDGKEESLRAGVSVISIR